MLNLNNNFFLLEYEWNVLLRRLLWQLPCSKTMASVARALVYW